MAERKYGGPRGYGPSIGLSGATVYALRRLENKTMRILHLSDIHFRAPECLDPDHDRDKPYRTRLERHLTGRVAAMGPIDAIMVGGDIAFQADPREYEVARSWLLDLAAKCGCDSASI